MQESLREFKKLIELNLKDRILFVTVYGSRVRGKATKLSDLDVAIYPKTKNLDEKLLIAYEIPYLASKAFNLPDDKIDLLFLDEEIIPIELLYKAVVEGILVYCSEMDFYKNFRLKILSEYMDFQVFRNKLKLAEKFLKALERKMHG